uniref:Uncharacterized protein n=1 Tax=Spongospora subterranea TaxID=70186 RepID=A0A0H5RLF1_9EUKA|eukprot:CRZ09554.1 hypothetical protein [Spongospora subterranea]
MLWPNLGDHQMETSYGGTNVYENRGVLMGNWVEDRFVSESRKRCSSTQKTAALPQSEQKCSYEWPDPSKSKDADTRARVSTFAVPPIPLFDTRAVLDRNIPAGIKVSPRDGPVNVLEWHIAHRNTDHIQQPSFPSTTYSTSHLRFPTRHRRG